MAGGEQKKRRLRSSDSQPAKNAAFLYNFDNVNRLLHANGQIQVNTKSPASMENLYSYLGDTCAELPSLSSQNMHIRHEPVELPRRRRRNFDDPLSDQVYETFHRRMKKDERSRTLTDRGRMYFEMDNLKTQLELLQQHDWNKHLPQITILKDRNDVDELLAKRSATIREIKRTLSKFANWEARCNTLAREMKEFETRSRESINIPKDNNVHGDDVHNKNNNNNNDDDDDDDDADDAEESILDVPIEVLARKRQDRRLAKHGRPLRIFLGNGYSLRYNPYLTPAVAVERESA